MKCRRPRGIQGWQVKIADSKYSKDFWNEDVGYIWGEVGQRKYLKKMLSKARRRINKRFVRRELDVELSDLPLIRVL